MALEDIEDIERFEELPIFPLDAVLFPGAILPLHIFEERYKSMLRYAIDHGGAFGLSYEQGAAVNRETPPEVGSVGCIAKIKAVMPAEAGRMNIVTAGLMRYRVQGFSQMLPFLIARVEPFTDDPEADAELTDVFDNLFEIGKQFLSAAQMLDESSIQLNEALPDDPEAFSFLVASALPLDNQSRQSLLEMTSTRVRLLRLRNLVTAVLAQYNERLKIQEAAKGNGHGRL
jgi:Lon protease-like protein